MPPRKPRAARSTAPTPSPALPSSGKSRSSRSRSNKTDASSSSETAESGVGVVVETDEDEQGDETATAIDGEAVESGEDEEVVDGCVGEYEAAGGEDAEPAVEAEAAAGGSKGKTSMEERMAKLKDLRMRMNQSTAANRQDLVTDHQKQKVTAKELQRLEKQKKLAQTLRLKTEAEASGEDVERRKAWEWSIEQNERWEAKQEESKIKSDTHFHNAEDDAWKLYNRNIRSTKADLLSYEKQKEAALGLAPGTLVPLNATSQSLQASGSRRPGALSAAEDLYRGADTLAYGDSKPSEDAVDRLTAKINKDMDKPGKRKKRVEEEGEINYINDRNKVFNKKVARYYDKYTKEIRANFERGTAL